jgi:branched-subunit amino acid ABC-type transport system permease component
MILIQILSGISHGAVLFVAAAGLTLTFGVLRIANFAHGSLYMVGAFATFSIMRWVGNSTAGFLTASVFAPLAVALLGAAIEVFLLRRISNRSNHYQLILTYSVTLIIADLAAMLYGRNHLSVPRPPLLDGGIAIAGFTFPFYNVVLIVVGLAVAIFLALIFGFTRLGKIIRAAVMDSEMVAASGINVRQLHTLVFAAGAWLAGLAGALAAPVGSISIGMDSGIIVECFAIVIIGGAGSISGAFIAAMGVGLIQSLGIIVAPRLASAFIFLVLFIILLVRPQGILGRA